MSVTTESLAKFGQLYLQKGQWHGRQLLPQSWVEEATEFKIQQPAAWNSGSDPAGQADYLASLSDPAAALGRLKRISDWYQGYAYQFWRCRHNAFRGDGAFGQFCVVLPEEDAVVAVTSETGNLQGALNLVWDHLLPAMSPGKRAASESSRTLMRALETRQLPLPPGKPSSPTAAKVSGRRFVFDANPQGMLEATLTFKPESCVVALKSASGAYQVTCGLTRWADGLTDLPGAPPSLVPRKQSGSIKIAAAGRRSDQFTFEMQWRFYETPHSDWVSFVFEGDDVRVQFLNSITAALGPNPALHPETRPVLRGTMRAAG